LILSSRELLAKAAALGGLRPDRDTANWFLCQQLEQHRAWSEQLLATEAGDHIKIWSRVKFGVERGVDVDRGFGYKTSSGVGQVIKRLKKEMTENEKLCSKLN